MEGLDLYQYWPYSQCYCEENVYRFLEKFAHSPPAAPEGQPPRKYDAYAAFITSYSATPGQEVEPGDWQSAVPIVAGPKPSDIVYWDYHCVACVKETAPPADGAGEASVRWWVVDYDTKMGRLKYVAPIPMELYFGFTLSAAGKNPVAMLEARVRFVTAAEFLSKFRTDRRHMWVRAVKKDDRYKKMTLFQLNNPTNYQHPPPRLARIQGPSPASAFLRGQISKEEAIAGVAKSQDLAGEENKSQNNLAQFLNTQNTKVCKSDLVGIKEIGQWIKAH